MQMSEEISSRLEYFQELDAATKLLNQPGESLVLNPDFLLMVERVDACLDFLRSNVRLVSYVNLHSSYPITTP